ncbi:MAG: hypothetical protein ACLQQ4_10655 [Bacteroidia bacterium]
MKTILLALGFISLSLTMQAQYTREDAPTPAPSQSATTVPQTSSFWNNVSIGSGFGLQFGTLTYVGLSPLFNYHIFDVIEIGIGPVYQYINISEQGYGSYSSTTYGGRISASYFLPGRLSMLYLHAEYDIMNVPDNYSIFSNITRATEEFPLAGIGLRRPIGEKSFYYIVFSYNFNNSLLSPYFSQPVMEAGFDFGI